MKVRDKVSLYEGATHRLNIYMPAEVIVGDSGVAIESLEIWDPKRHKWLDFLHALDKGIVVIDGYNVQLATS